jgi:hypothetical protein
MTIRRFLLAMGVNYRELWPEAPAQRWRERHDLLDDKLKRRYEGLIRCRHLIERLRHDIDRTERHASAVGGRLQTLYSSAKADKVSRVSEELLESQLLHQAHHDLLERQQRRYERQLMKVEELKRRRSRAREMLAMVSTT